MCFRSGYSQEIISPQNILTVWESKFKALNIESKKVTTIIEYLKDGLTKLVLQPKKYDPEENKEIITKIEDLDNIAKDSYKQIANVLRIIHEDIFEIKMYLRTFNKEVRRAENSTEKAIVSNVYEEERVIQNCFKQKEIYTNISLDVEFNKSVLSKIQERLFSLKESVVNLIKESLSGKRNNSNDHSNAIFKEHGEKSEIKSQACLKFNSYEIKVNETNNNTFVKKGKGKNIRKLHVMKKNKINGKRKKIDSKLSKSNNVARTSEVTKDPLLELDSPKRRLRREFETIHKKNRNNTNQSLKFDQSNKAIKNSSKKKITNKVFNNTLEEINEKKIPRKNSHHNFVGGTERSKVKKYSGFKYISPYKFKKIKGKVAKGPILQPNISSKQQENMLNIEQTQRVIFMGDRGDNKNSLPIDSLPVNLEDDFKSHKFIQNVQRSKSVECNANHRMDHCNKMSDSTVYNIKPYNNDTDLINGESKKTHIEKSQLKTLSGNNKEMAPKMNEKNAKKVLGREHSNIDKDYVTKGVSSVQRYDYGEKCGTFHDFRTPKKYMNERINTVLNDFKISAKSAENLREYNKESIIDPKDILVFEAQIKGEMKNGINTNVPMKRKKLNKMDKLSKIEEFSEVTKTRSNKKNDRPKLITDTMNLDVVRNLSKENNDRILTDIDKWGHKFPYRDMYPGIKVEEENDSKGGCCLILFSKDIKKHTGYSRDKHGGMETWDLITKNMTDTFATDITGENNLSLSENHNSLSYKKTKKSLCNNVKYGGSMKDKKNWIEASTFRKQLGKFPQSFKGQTEIQKRNDTDSIDPKKIKTKKDVTEVKNNLKLQYIALNENLSTQIERVDVMPKDSTCTNFSKRKTELGKGDGMVNKGAIENPTGRPKENSKNLNTNFDTLPILEKSDMKRNSKVNSGINDRSDFKTSNEGLKNYIGMNSEEAILSKNIKEDKTSAMIAKSQCEMVTSNDSVPAVVMPIDDIANRNTIRELLKKSQTIKRIKEKRNCLMAEKTPSIESDENNYECLFRRKSSNACMGTSNNFMGDSISIKDVKKTERINEKKLIKDTNPIKFLENILPKMNKKNEKTKYNNLEIMDSKNLEDKVVTNKTFINYNKNFQENKINQRSILEICDVDESKHITNDKNNDNFKDQIRKLDALYLEQSNAYEVICENNSNKKVKKEKTGRDSHKKEKKKAHEKVQHEIIIDNVLTDDLSPPKLSKNAQPSGVEMKYNYKEKENETGKIRKGRCCGESATQIAERTSEIKERSLEIIVEESIEEILVDSTNFPFFDDLFEKDLLELSNDMLFDSNKESIAPHIEEIEMDFDAKVTGVDKKERQKRLDKPKYNYFDEDVNEASERTEEVEIIESIEKDTLSDSMTDLTFLDLTDAKFPINTDDINNPKYWPTYTYRINIENSAKCILACILKAKHGCIGKQSNLQCLAIPTEKPLPHIDLSEDAASVAFELRPTAESLSFNFNPPWKISIAHVLSKNSQKELVILCLSDDSTSWIELPTFENSAEELKEHKSRFVEATLEKPSGIFIVQTKTKIDDGIINKYGARITSSIDSRVLLAVPADAIRITLNTTLKLNIIDNNFWKELKAKSEKTPLDHVICASHIIDFNSKKKKLRKPANITCFLPQNPEIKKMLEAQSKTVMVVKKAYSFDEDESFESETPSKSEHSKTELDAFQKSLMLTGITGANANENIQVVCNSVEEDKWFPMENIQLSTDKSKELMTMELPILQSLRFIMVRTHKNTTLENLAKGMRQIEHELSVRNSLITLMKSTKNPYQFVLLLGLRSRSERSIEQWKEEGFQMEVQNLPVAIELFERQLVTARFTGNITNQKINRDELRFTYQSLFQINHKFQVRELDSYAQRAIDHYRGYLQIYVRKLVKKPIEVLDPKNRKNQTQYHWIEDDVLVCQLLISIPKRKLARYKFFKDTLFNRKLLESHISLFGLVAEAVSLAWRDLGLVLGVSESRMQSIRHHNNPQKYERMLVQMLVFWLKGLEMIDNKEELLIKGLYDINRVELVGQIRKYLDNGGSISDSII